MIYTIAPFPFVHLAELREKYRFNITPFAAQGAVLQKARQKGHSRHTAAASAPSQVHYCALISLYEYCTVRY